jgi:uncharacterized protein
MFSARTRRQRQAVRFVELVVADALEPWSATLAKAVPGTRRTRALRRRDGEVVCERCLVADSPLPRMRGLLGRSGLGSDEGVLLRPAGSVHTFFMRFPIDVVFLDRDGRVLRIAEALRPWRSAGARGARSVLELRVGECARRGLAAGDVLEL